MGAPGHIHARRTILKQKDMEKRDITICGKTVTVAYCFATEIGFRNYTNTPLEGFDGNNPEHIAYLILSAITANYQCEGTDAPVTDKELLYDSKPEEIIDALTVIFELRAMWYKMPKGEPKDDAQGEGAGKNA